MALAERGARLVSSFVLETSRHKWYHINSNNSSFTNLWELSLLKTPCQVYFRVSFWGVSSVLINSSSAHGYPLLEKMSESSSCLLSLHPWISQSCKLEGTSRVDYPAANTGPETSCAPQRTYFVSRHTERGSRLCLLSSLRKTGYFPLRYGL